MKTNSRQIKIAILKILKEIGGSAGSVRIKERLVANGIDLQPRTIRSYLLEMDKEGLTRFVSRRRGRQITEYGYKELECAHIVEKIGFIAGKIDSMIYQMDYDLLTGKGNIITNLALVNRKDLVYVLECMHGVFRNHLGMGNRIRILYENEKLGNVIVPPGKVLIATICSITINGILLKAGIPVLNRYGGLMEIENKKPRRFVALIEYSGTSLDPLEFFIRGKMTQVNRCVNEGRGIVLVSFREIPMEAIEDVRRIKKRLQKYGLDGILTVGLPGQSLFDIPVRDGRVGLIVIGGLNPIAAVYERDIEIEFKSLFSIEDISLFFDFDSLLEKINQNKE